MTSQLRRKMLIGSTIWIFAIQYFIVECLAIRAWSPAPYSFRVNTISDLAATVCGILPNVGCSTLHSLMNVSFAVSCLITISGMSYVTAFFPAGRGIRTGLLLISLGSLGSVGVALFPENENMTAHVISAATFFILSNVGLLVLGISLFKKNWYRTHSIVTAALGVIGLVALAVLPLTWSVISGVGVVERFVTYPVTIWLLLTGIFFLVQVQRRTLPE